MNGDNKGSGFLRPPIHPSRSSVLSGHLSSNANSSFELRPPIHPSSTPSSTSSAVDLPPRIPPRPAPPECAVTSLAAATEDDSGTRAELQSESRVPTPTPTSPNLGVGTSTDGLSEFGVKDEESLSEVQLRELYDDEEIERFLHLFSSNVREVRVADSVSGPQVTQPALVSTPVLPGHQPSYSTFGSPEQGTARSSSSNWDVPISERIALDLVAPLLPPPRPPPPEFTLGRLRQTSQRLYVALEPVYGRCVKPVLELATWKDPKKSFVCCALYWMLWYHGLLMSALVLCLLYQLLRQKLHPYPSLAELRELRRRIDRADTFSTVLSERLTAPSAFGVRDVWTLAGDYMHIRKLKKAKLKEAAQNGLGPDTGPSGNDDSSIHSGISLSSAELLNSTELAPGEEEEEDENVKRLGLFIMNEVADLLERTKNIFLWRQPTASASCGVALLGCLFVGLLPARYLVKLVGFSVGVLFWHVVPVIAAMPTSDRKRIPPPFTMVPTDTEYAMELISQRVARGLPVKPKRRRPGRKSSGSSDLLYSAEDEGSNGSTASVDWKKWGERIVSTKERAGGIKQIFQDGQWKQVDNWKSLNPLAPKVVTSQSGSEPRIETQTFPAQLKTIPGIGLVTLTPTTLFFTPLWSSHPTLTIQLATITGVKKVGLVKGIDVNYTQSHEGGIDEQKKASFMFVGSRSELFARLVSWGGRRWSKV